MSQSRPSIADTKPALCFLCSKQIVQAPGSRIVQVTFEREDTRFFHLNCFVAFTTGSLRDGDIWAYRIVGRPAKEHADAG